MTPSFFAQFRRSRVAICLAALWVAAGSPCQAQTLSWSTPLGEVTIFGSGPRATFLQTSASLGDVESADFLDYLDASGSPAVSRSEALTTNASFVSVAQLTVGESETGGLPFTAGSIGFSSTGAGGGNGSGGITLYMLINVPSPVMIDLSGIRSAITSAGSSSNGFSLELFQSDVAGTRIGDALLSYSGNLFDQSGAYQSSSPYYLLAMNVAAAATPDSSGAVEFSFALDLQNIVAVPEPNSASLLVLPFLGLAIYRFRKVGKSLLRGGGR